MNVLSDSVKGCRYKHIMPMDLKTLERIGLRDIPAWYREKYNVPSLRQGNQNRNKIPNIQQDCRKSVTCEWRQGNLPEHKNLSNGSLANETTVSPNFSLTFQQSKNFATIPHQTLYHAAGVTTLHQNSGPEMATFGLERHSQAEYMFRYRHLDASNRTRPTGSFSSSTSNSALPSSSSFSSSSSPCGDHGFRAPRAPFAQKSLIDPKSSQITKAIINEDADDTLDFWRIT